MSQKRLALLEVLFTESGRKRARQRDGNREKETRGPASVSVELFDIVAIA